MGRVSTIGLDIAKGALESYRDNLAIVARLAQTDPTTASQVCGSTARLRQCTSTRSLT
jgi:hypothetical protein